MGQKGDRIFLFISYLFIQCSILPAFSVEVSKPESGLIYYAKYEYRDNLTAIKNPYITAALFQFYWGVVESQEGVYDWSDFDRCLEPWTNAGKFIALRFMWCSSGLWPDPSAKTPTPRWVWEKGARFAFHQASETEIPLFWDPIYQRYAKRFMEAVGKKYGENPYILLIDVTPGAETNPYRFGTIGKTDPSFQNRFITIPASDGRTYTEDLWQDMIFKWIDESKAIFDRVGIETLVTLNTGGFENKGQMTRIGNYLANRGVCIGQNGLRGSSYPDTVNQPGQRTKNFQEWSTKTRLFFEMYQSSFHSGQGTLMETMEAAARIHGSFLNVYPEDCIAGTSGGKGYSPEMENALRFGHGVLTSRK